MNATRSNAATILDHLPSKTMTTLTGKASYGPQIIAPPNNRDGTSKSDLEVGSAAAQSNLTSKLAGDAVIGSGVTFLVAPFLTIVDKAIVQRASGTHTLMRSCLHSFQGMVSNPQAFVRNPAFLYVWAVYASTYTTANSLKTLVEHQEQQAATRTKSKSNLDNNADWGKVGIFLGTSAANSGASVMKDRAFAYMFSADSAATAVAKKVPVASYGLWMSRDLIGVGSSFVLPDLIARKLSESNPEDESRNRDISQFCVPIATQLVAGPLHLLGLDLFNRPMQAMTLKERVLERSRFLVNGYAAVVSARVARIIPGYGFGGVLNTKFRDGWREHLVKRDPQEGLIQSGVAVLSALKRRSIEL